MSKTKDDVLFFATPKDLREWLKKNHDQSMEQWVGFYKKASGKPSITWPESVDEALCYGWIDGLRKSIDEVSYKIRFTPRKPRSHWSAVNIKRVAELKKLGLMQPTGLAAFEKRDTGKSAQAAYEQGKVEMNPVYEAEIKKNKKAWAYWENKAPSYRTQCVGWVMSAKKEETQHNRLKVLIESCQKEEVIPPMRWGEKKKN